MPKIDVFKVKNIFRRVYFGKKEKIGFLQVFRAFTLLGLTLTLLVTPFVPSTPKAALTQSPTESVNPTKESSGPLEVSSELVSKTSEINTDLGQVDSGFTKSELSKFKNAYDELNKYLSSAESKNLASLVSSCKKLNQIDSELLAVHKRVNNMNIVQPKFDKYWGLASTYLVLGNFPCQQIKSKDSLSTLSESKIVENYSRSAIYFDKIITEGTAQVLSNQKEVDAVKLKAAIADEDAYNADVTARVKMYFASDAGFSKDELKRISSLRPYLMDYITSIKSSNLIGAAASCSVLEERYKVLIGTSSDSQVYEESLDRLKDYAFEGIEDCNKGFKKNRINLLTDAAAKFATSIGYLDYILKSAKQLS